MAAGAATAAGGPQAGVPQVGGVLLATKDVARLVAWYRELGFPLSDEGVCILGAGGATADPAHGMAFSIHPARGELPAAGGDLRERPYGLQRVTLRLRIPDLGAALASLRRRRVEFAGPREQGEGLCAWTKDPDGNFVELWQARANP